MYRRRRITVKMDENGSVHLHDQMRRPQPILSIEVEELNARGMYVSDDEMEEDARDLAEIISRRFETLPEYSHPTTDEKLKRAVMDAVLPGPGFNDPPGFEVKFNPVKVRIDD